MIGGPVGNMAEKGKKVKKAASGRKKFSRCLQPRGCKAKKGAKCLRLAVASCGECRAPLCENHFDVTMNGCGKLCPSCKGKEQDGITEERAGAQKGAEIGIAVADSKDGEVRARVGTATGSLVCDAFRAAKEELRERGPVIHIRGLDAAGNVRAVANRVSGESSIWVCVHADSFWTHDIVGYAGDQLELAEAEARGWVRAAAGIASRVEGLDAREFNQAAEAIALAKAGEAAKAKVPAPMPDLVPGFERPAAGKILLRDPTGGELSSLPGDRLFGEPSAISFGDGAGAVIKDNGS